MHRGGKIRVLLAAGAFLLLSGLATAIEPDGVIGLRPEWVAASDPSDPEAGRVLDLGIRPALALRDAQLVVDLPPGAGWLGLPSGAAGPALEESVAPDGTRSVRIPLGDVAAMAQRVIRMAFTHAPGSGAVVTLRVEGLGPEGTLAEAVGVTVGHPGSPGRSRNGALEYRAVPRPEEAP